MNHNKIIPASMHEATIFGRGVGKGAVRASFPYLAGIYGAEEPGQAPAGLHTRSDLIDRVPGTQLTRDGQPVSEIWDELNLRNGVFNRTANFLVALLTFPTTSVQDRVAQYTTAKFQQATELGRPRKVRLAYQTRGFPLEHYDLGFGFTQEMIDGATARELLQVADQAERAYWDLQLDVIFEALFSNANATDEDGINVKRLYNNDGEVPPEYKRWTHTGSHTHYLTSGNTSPTAANLDTVEEHLIHHGYGENGETLVLHIHRDQVAAVTALAKFVPAAAATRPAVLSGPVRGQERSAPAGLEIVGYHNKLVIVENNMMVSGYMLATATGGTFATQNPVGLRLHENPSARGLRLIEGGRQNYPIVDSVYDCYVGAGVRQRGSAAVMQITAGAYTVPTF